MCFCKGSAQSSGSHLVAHYPQVPTASSTWGPGVRVLEVGVGMEGAAFYGCRRGWRRGGGVLLHGSWQERHTSPARSRSSLRLSRGPREAVPRLRAGDLGLGRPAVKYYKQPSGQPKLTSCRNLPLPSRSLFSLAHCLRVSNTNAFYFPRFPTLVRLGAKDTSSLEWRVRLPVVPRPELKPANLAY